MEGKWRKIHLFIFTSSDGAITNHADDPKFNEMMEKLGSLLNLRAHWVGKGKQKKKISLCSGKSLFVAVN
jgi:hypothetical protein